MGMYKPDVNELTPHHNQIRYDVINKFPPLTSLFFSSSLARPPIGGFAVLNDKPVMQS
jgi:hypothetical protein